MPDVRGLVIGEEFHDSTYFIDLKQVFCYFTVSDYKAGQVRMWSYGFCCSLEITG